MINNHYIRVIIPAFNEEASIGKVISDIPSFVDETIVVSNRSTDKTEEVAAKNKATVLSEPRRGYGYACLKGLDYLSSNSIKTDIVVFLDGDYSDYPQEMLSILNPILHDQYDFVIGARASKFREKGAMTFPQIFGNWLATHLMRLIWNASFTDLGPFRAITYKALLKLEMEDKTYGWTVEMQVKALIYNLNIAELTIKSNKRIGKSKISGTIKGTFLASFYILKTLLILFLKHPRRINS